MLSSFPTGTVSPPKQQETNAFPVAHLLNAKERLSGVVQVSNAPCRGYEEWQGENAEVERPSTDRCSAQSWLNDSRSHCDVAPRVSHSSGIDSLRHCPTRAILNRDRETSTRSRRRSDSTRGWAR